MRLVPVLVALFAVRLPPVLAQQALNLVVVQGEGAINNVRQRTARDPIVRVEDQNHKPIAGAVVAFILPTQGAGGAFGGGAQMLSVITNSRGLAIAKGFHPNSLGGPWQMHINASFGAQSATATVAQTNVVAAAAGAAGAGGAGAGAATGVAVGISAKVIVIVAVAAGAAAAGGAVVATKAGGGSSSTPTTIAPGASTVGAPPK
jgi:hypothetical protein